MRMKAFQRTVRNIVRTLSILWRADRWMFAGLLVVTLVESLFPLIVIYANKLLIDYLTVHQGLSIGISVGLISIFIIRYGSSSIDELTSVYSVYVNRISRYIFENVIALEFAGVFARLDIAQFEDSAVQDLINKISREGQWRMPQFVLWSLYVIGSLISFVAACIALSSFGVWPLLILLVAAIPGFILRIQHNKDAWSLYSINTRQAKELRYLNDVLTDRDNAKEIRIAQAAPKLLNRFQNLQNTVFQRQKDLSRSHAMAWLLPVVLESAVLIGLGFFAVRDTLHGLITVGSLVFYVQMLDQFRHAIGGFGNQLATLYEGTLYVDDYFALMNLPNVIPEASPGHVFEHIKPPGVEFLGVSFAYPDGTSVLHNISFSLKPGEHLAIVGANGAGKSTLIKLLLRFYDPIKGSVRVNDYDLKQLPLKHWYQFVGTLFQGFVKFHLTVQDNIAFGATTVDESRMKEAARMSGADTFIEKFPDGYNTRLGKEFEGAVDLSEGQWQKLALARAFYERPPLLILDEPTSAIDAEGEAFVFDNLIKVYSDKTIVFVSHRFSTVRNADKILVIADGRIIEEGGHKELMKKKGEYARLFNLQAKGYQD